MANRFVSADTFMGATISLQLHFGAFTIDTPSPVKKDIEIKASLAIYQKCIVIVLAVANYVLLQTI